MSWWLPLLTLWTCNTKSLQDHGKVNILIPKLAIIKKLGEKKNELFSTALNIYNYTEFIYQNFTLTLTLNKHTHDDIH